MTKTFVEPLCQECFTQHKTLFNNLSKEEIDSLNYNKTCSLHKKGDILYKEGKRINGIYCVQRGLVKIYKTGVEGKEQILRFAKKGNIIGYRSVLNGEPACTTAKMLEETVLCYISMPNFYSMLKKNNDFAIEILQLACTELGGANNLITEIAQKSVRERLAEILILLKDEFGQTEDGVINIALTREEIANMIGTATESVIRLLSEFKNDKLIELRGRKIAILDLSKLKKTGNIY